MIRTQFMRFLLLTAASVLLIGCGLKGDLYLEEPPTDNVEAAREPSTEPATESDENTAAD